MCDHRYPTKTCGRSNPAVRSSWDNVTSPHRGGRASREVRTSKPKALTGLNQKVRGQVQGLSLPLPSLSSHRRTGRA
jgi:hypothetical protein